MNTYRITCNTGNTWVTSFRGTFREAVDYYLGKRFERADESGYDTVTLVQEVL